MLPQNLLHFYNSWTEKANRIVGNDLSDVYDKYITLFITYNSLYNKATEELAISGVRLPNKIYDSKAATEYVVRYLGGVNILNALSNSNNDRNVSILIDILDRELFYIKLRLGQRQRNEDLKILAGLRSTNSTTKAIAVLQVAYYVRCNMFHGHKQFGEYQRVLLDPLTNILRTISLLLFDELNR